MRLLHTADWHLGQRFHGFDRLHEQERFLNWLAKQIDEQGVDALLIAGDVFDTLSPSSHSLRLLYDFLARIAASQPGLQVVMIAGNHDSGLRLEAAQPLLSALNVHVRGIVPRLPDGAIDYGYFAIPLRSRKGEEVLCVAVPYLRPADCPIVEEGGDPFLAFFQGLRTHLPAGDVPRVAMAHLFAANAVSSSGAVPVMGGLERVSAAAFPPEVYDYVALGHLHRAQRVYGLDTVRYSGSPLPMSFAEKEYSHEVLLVDLNADGVHISPLAYESPVKLLELSGTPSAIREQMAQMPSGEPDQWAPILSLIVELDGPRPSLRREVQEWAEGRYVRLGPMRAHVPEVADPARGKAVLVQGRIDPVAVAQQVYQSLYKTDMPTPLLSRFLQAIEASKTPDPHANSCD